MKTRHSNCTQLTECFRGGGAVIMADRAELRFELRFVHKASREATSARLND